MSLNVVNAFTKFASGGGGITELDDTEWVCNFEQWHNSNANNLCLEFLSDGATPSYSGSYYGLGMFLQDNGSKYYNITTANNNGTRTESAYPSGSTGLNSYKNVVLFTTATRLSATSFKTEVFTDSNRTSSLGSATMSVNSAIQGLNQICAWANGTGGNYYIKNVEIWNGTTSASGDPDYSNDFSDSSGWTIGGTGTVNVDSAHSDAIGATSTKGGDYAIRTFS